jgi:hypothetical protein
VRLSGEVEDRVDLTREPVDEVMVADVAVDEAVASRPFEFADVGRIAGVGELVENRELDVRACTPEPANEVRPNEPGATGHQQPAQTPVVHLIGGPAVQS